MLVEKDHEKEDRAQWPEYTAKQEIEMELEHWEQSYPDELARIKSLKIQLAEENLRIAKEGQENSELHRVMQNMEPGMTFLIDDSPY